MINKLPKTCKILFSESHDEQLKISKEDQSEVQFSLLRQVLNSLKYEISPVNKVITSSNLADAKILVIGAPKFNLKAKLTEEEEIKSIKQFVTNGGGLLLISNAKTMFNPPFWLSELASMANLEFQEYHNYPQSFLESFEPHYITANVKQVKIGNISFLKVDSPARSIAFTKITQEEAVIACSKVGLGRVVAVGDLSIFTDEILNLEIENQNKLIENQKTLITNIFVWLAAKNIIDVENIDIPVSVKWEEKATITLQLSNHDENARPQVECVLESWKGLEISERAQKISIPEDKPTMLRWSVKPLTLGEQELRLSIYPEGYPPLFFDQLPEMCCIAPGYFTIETVTLKDELKTDFLTNEPFKVAGTFHWKTETTEQLPYQLELEFDDGLKEYRTSDEENEGTRCWYLQAVKPGTHTVRLKLLETGQSFPGIVTVKPSIEDRLGEIKAAYIKPLEAEIIERLKQLNVSLVDESILKQPFNILLPEQFIDAVYKENEKGWMRELLKAAHREQRHNLDLLNLVLTYIIPSYLSHYGTFIPYDPGLASHLIKFHPSRERYIVSNLLSSEESDDIQVKQNIAAYLLHEKFGHGFFYNQTNLGKQLKILQYYNDIQEIIELIEDSALIVNEGFAVWLELSFLAKLDREVRQAANLREILLIHEATGLYQREETSEFFQRFPPKFDSRYREGFEYFDFISRNFNQRCVIKVLFIATDIDFGITKDHLDTGNIDIEKIKSRLLEPNVPNWRSHERLSTIADLLLNDEDIETVKQRIQRQLCPADCHKSKCPLETFITQKLKWRAHELQKIERGNTFYN
jgi:hypothetical protein